METFDGALAPDNGMDPEEILRRSEAFDPTQRITAIPTRYKGYTFRSRTEARWGVFYDALPIRFEYEPEGLMLPNGQLYLPDFYLPDFKWFCEVKPSDGILEVEDKAKRFGLNGSVDVLFLVGPPDFKAYRGISGGYDDGLDYSLDIHMWPRATQEKRFYAGPCYGQGDTFSDKYRAAVYASRAERFGR